MTRGDDLPVVGFEITEIPRAYVESGIATENQSSPQWTMKNTNLQFERFLNSVLHAGIRFVFRIESSAGDSRLLYLLPQDDINVFGPIHRAHFQDFNIEPFEQQTPAVDEGQVHVCTFTGVPKASPKSLDAMSEIITNFPGHAFYQTYSLPSKPSRIKRAISKHRLKTALEKSTD